MQAVKSRKIQAVKSRKILKGELVLGGSVKQLQQLQPVLRDLQARMKNNDSVEEHKEVSVIVGGRRRTLHLVRRRTAHGDRGTFRLAGLADWEGQRAKIVWGGVGAGRMMVWIDFHSATNKKSRPVPATHNEHPPIPPANTQSPPVPATNIQPPPVPATDNQSLPVLAANNQPPPILATNIQPLSVPATKIRPPPVLAANIHVPTANFQPPPIPAAIFQTPPVPAASVQPPPVPAANIQPPPVPAASIQPPPVLAASIQAPPVPIANIQLPPVPTANIQPPPVPSTNHYSVESAPANTGAVQTPPTANVQALYGSYLPAMILQRTYQSLWAPYAPSSKYVLLVDSRIAQLATTAELGAWLLAEVARWFTGHADIGRSRLAAYRVLAPGAVAIELTEEVGAAVVLASQQLPQMGLSLLRAFPCDDVLADAASSLAKAMVAQVCRHPAAVPRVVRL